MKGWRRRCPGRTPAGPGCRPRRTCAPPEAALAYPGTALLEGTNVSEGRGTETPFLLLGAPWLKAGGASSRRCPRPASTFEATTFTPEASPAAPEPKHVGVPCSRHPDHGQGRGRGHAVQARASRLLVALKGQAGFEWLRGGAAIDRLVGTKKLRAAIDRGDPVDAIVAADLPLDRGVPQGAAEVAAVLTRLGLARVWRGRSVLQPIMATANVTRSRLRPRSTSTRRPGVWKT